MPQRTLAPALDHAESGTRSSLLIMPQSKFDICCATVRSRTRVLPVDTAVAC